MKRINKKLRKQTMAAILALVIGMTAGITSFADELGKFDPVFYAQTYPDVAAVLGTDAEALYNHYITCGQKEGRVPYAGAAVGAAVDGIVGTTAAPVPAAASTTSTERVTDPTKEGYQPVYDLSNWTPEQMALLAQKQQEFDASGYVKVGWTEAQVYERLMWIKENLYPEGTKVGICMAGANAITKALYGDRDYWEVGLDNNGDSVYPEGYPYTLQCSRFTLANIRDGLRVGDTLYTAGVKTGHISVVLSHDDRGITVVESNMNGDQKMYWGRFISWDELENGGNTIYKQQNHWGSLRHKLY